MTGVETRGGARDSLFLLADIRVEQSLDVHRVRVRNLSDGGMMAEGNLRVQRGHRVEVSLRNVGNVPGSVAWVQDDRFGIAFDEAVDSQKARLPLQGGELLDAAVITPSWSQSSPQPLQPSTARKI
ncbi:MAG: PilZ domain-containing protein [Erythrobacter sp.]|nr:PilZ domain-containing protein [Erythrobacter sp.]